MAVYHAGLYRRRPHLTAWRDHATPPVARRPTPASKTEIVVVGDNLTTVIALAAAVEGAGSGVTALHRSDVMAAAARALARQPAALLLIWPPERDVSEVAGLVAEAENTVIAIVRVRPGRPLRADVTYTIPGRTSHQTDLKTFLRLQTARRPSPLSEFSRDTPRVTTPTPGQPAPDILLVEDDAAIAEVLERALAARGWDVALAPTGGEAVASIERSRPGLLLLDINLPDITGWEVLRRVGEGGRADMPVVVYSASPLSPARVEEFRPAGVLMKPFPVAALIRLVRELTGSPETKEVIADA